jgi:uncharacterized protein YjbI with pentapeptide repeats
MNNEILIKFKLKVKDSGLIDYLKSDFTFELISSNRLLYEQFEKAVNLVLYKKNTYSSIFESMYFQSDLIEALYLLHESKYGVYDEWLRYDNKKIELIREYDPTFHTAYISCDGENCITSSTHYLDMFASSCIEPTKLYDLTEVVFYLSIYDQYSIDNLLDQLVLCVNVEVVIINVEHDFYDNNDNFDDIDLSKLECVRNLRELTLYNVNFDMNILQKFQTLETLQFINIPNIELIPLFANLTHLYVKNTKLTRCQSFDQNLISLTLDNVEFDGCMNNITNTSFNRFDFLSSLKNLSSLNLSHTLISDLSPISSLTSLRTLNLSHTRVCTVKEIRALTSLEDLNLSGCVIRDKSLFKNNKISYLEFLFGKKEMVFPLANIRANIDVGLISYKICK